MSDHELKRAIEALTARVEQLERELAAQGGKPEVLRRVAAPPTQPTAPPIHPVPPTPPPRIEPPKPVMKPPIAPPVSIPAYQQARRPHPPTPTKAPGRSLELLIGRQVVAWIGAIVILFGVGYFVKYAYDQGWLAALSPLETISEP